MKPSICCDGSVRVRGDVEGSDWRNMSQPEMHARHHLTNQSHAVRTVMLCSAREGAPGVKQDSCRCKRRRSRGKVTCKGKSMREEKWTHFHWPFSCKYMKPGHQSAQLSLLPFCSNAGLPATQAAASVVQKLKTISSAAVVLVSQTACSCCGYRRRPAAAALMTLADLTASMDADARLRFNVPFRPSLSRLSILANH